MLVEVLDSNEVDKVLVLVGSSVEVVIIDAKRVTLKV